MPISALVVDADRIFVDSLVELLEGMGVLALGATNRASAERHLSTIQPEALILDAHMPGARELLQFIPQNVPHTRVVVLSRTPHQLGSGDFVVLDRSHGLHYLTTTLGALVGPGIAAEAGAILIANGRDPARERLQQVIQRLAGYAVYTVTRSKDALDFIAVAPDTRVLLMDVEMPDRGGADCLKEIFGSKAHPEVIITSRLLDAEVARNVLRLGAFDYIYEPFAPPVVHGALGTAVLHWEYRRSKSLWGKILPRFARSRKYAARS